MRYCTKLSFTAMQASIIDRKFSPHLRANCIRKIWLGPIFALTLTMLLVLNCGGSFNPDLDEGLGFYRQNQLEEALPLLEHAVEQDPQNPDAYAWLAETYRRSKQIDKAISAARKAIEIDPCHSFAHTVLADAFNPHYGPWEGVNSDSTWDHLLKAVTCDSSDGNAWLGIWTEAIRRGELYLEKKALHSIVETGFLASAVLSYNRWMLRHLPADAILLTNGDMDTYPAVAIQEVEQFRKDVAVVNNSLLNTPWYARFIRDRYEIPLPFRDSELDSLGPYRDENGNVVLVSKQIFSGWLNLRQSGVFPHPIAISVTVSQNVVSEIKDHLTLGGAYWLWNPDPVETILDTVVIRNSLASINPDHFVGSFVSPNDRSPIRRKYSNGMVNNVTSLVLRYSGALIESDRKSEAFKWLTWVEQFQNVTELGPAFTEQIEELKEAASSQ